MIKSKVTGKQYSETQVVYFGNLLQSMRYMQHGAIPVDILVSRDKLIFVFKKEDHVRLRDKWKNHLLDPQTEEEKNADKQQS